MLQAREHASASPCSACPDVTLPGAGGDGVEARLQPRSDAREEEPDGRTGGGEGGEQVQDATVTGQDELAILGLMGGDRTRG